MSAADLAGPTVEQSLRHAARQLEESGIATARLDAEVLLAGALGAERIHLYSDPGRRLTPEESSRYGEFIRRRSEGENVAYIRGRKEFYSLAFAVTPAVLIPRPETELLVDLALEALRKSNAPAPRVLDLATGSGCIAISIAKNHPACRIVASDISRDALAVARHNAEAHGVAGRIEFVESNGVQGLINRGPFDVIVSNPPYIRTRDIDLLDAGIRRYEPRLALDGGGDGLCFYREAIPQMPRLIAPGGIVLFEIGWDQGEEVSELMLTAFPKSAAEVRKDGAGMDRVVGMFGVQASA